ncbi:MAG: hypothetical protein LBH00_05985 [Planctomycetaceae bacterium]|jgi:hypothetical protein|nr:hypothetical protein [Planctomycetaceae bacterium]
MSVSERTTAGTNIPALSLNHVILTVLRPVDKSLPGRQSCRTGIFLIDNEKDGSLQTADGSRKISLLLPSANCCLPSSPTARAAGTGGLRPHRRRIF